MNTSENDNIVAPSLEAEAREFSRQSIAKKQAIDKVFVVLDCEFKWNREAHRLYQAIESGTGENEIRWPFCSIVCASWLTLRFRALDEEPIIEDFTTMTMPSNNEAEIVQALCRTLSKNSTATAITWGGEAKDYASIRRAAAAHDIRLPPQIQDGNPHTSRRIDLANATSCQAPNVHLPEFATSIGIPAKLMMPSRSIGQLVEAENWPLVREVCEQDVATTALIAGRYLSTHGLVSATGSACDLAISRGIIGQRPESEFAQKYLVPWFRERT